MRSSGLVLAALLFAYAAWAAESWPVVRVIDGDTVQVRIGERLDVVRVLGVDAPETGGRAKCAYERRLGERAKAYAGEFLSGGPALFEARSRRDKYGRILAVVTVNGRDLAEALIEAKLGRAYQGGRREGWCS